MDNNQNGEKPKSRKRWILILIIAAVVVFLLAIAPTALSNQMGADILAGQLQKRIEGKVQIDSISLSWFGKQKIRLFSCTTNNAQIRVESIISNRSIFDFIFGKGLEKEIELIAPSLDMVLAKKSPSQTNQRASLALFSQNFHISRGYASISLAENKVIKLREVDILFSKPVNRLQIEATTQDEQNTGNLQLDAHANINSKMIIDSGSIKGKFEQFPIAAIDALLSLKYPQVQNLFTEAVGPILNGKVQCLFAPPTFSCMVQASGKNIAVDLTTLTNDGVSTVDPNSSVEWLVTPRFFSTITQQKFSLSAPSKVSISPRNLVINGKEKGFSFREMHGGIHILIPKTSIQGKTLKGPLQFTSGLLNISTNLRRNDIIVKAEADLLYGSQKKAPLLSEFTLTNAFDITSSILHRSFLENIRLLTDNFPISLIDNFFGLDNLFSNIFGEFLRLDLGPNEIKGKKELTCDFGTTNLQMEQLQFDIGEIAQLNNMPTYQYTPTNTLRKKYKNISFDTVYGDISKFEIPMSPWGGNLRSIVLFTNFASDQFKWKVNNAYGSLFIDHPHVSAEVNSLDDIKIKTNTVVELLKEDSLLQLLCGKSVNVDLESTFDMLNLKQVVLPILLLKFTSDRIHGALEGALYNHFSTIRLHKPLNIELLTPPALFNNYLLPKDAAFSYTPYSPFLINIKPTTFTLAPPYSKNMDIEFEYVLPNIALLPKEGDPLFYIKDTSGNVYSKKNDVEIVFSSKGSVTAKDSSPGKFSTKVKTETLRGNSLTQHNFVGEAELHDIPNAFFDLIFGDGIKMRALLGEHTSAKIKLAQTQPEITFTTEVNTSNLTGKGGFSLGESLQLFPRDAPLRLKWELDSAGFKQLSRGKQPFTLNNTASFKGEISYLDIPLKKKIELDQVKFSPKKYIQALALDPANMKINAFLQGGRIAVENSDTKEVAEFYKPLLTLSQKEKVEPFTLTFKSDVKTTDTAQKKQIGTIQSSLYMNPSPVDKTMRFDLISNLRNFPAMLGDVALQTFTQNPIPLSYITGPTLSGKIKSQITNKRGKLEANITSQNCKMDIVGDVLDGDLTLTKPFEASLIPSKNLVNLLLNQYDISFVNAQKPIVMRIAPRDTLIPLRHFSLNKLSLPYIYLDPGKLTCRNTGNPLVLSSLFKLNIETGDLISLWFAPIEAKMRRSNLYIDRTEILFNNMYEIASWGTVDFKDRYVNMLLGLTAQSLGRALGIRNLPPSFVIPIPLRGPFGDVRLDKEIATAKIALLYARRKGLTPKGGVWGSVFDTLGTLAEDQSQVPPAKPPFPWQNRQNGQMNGQ